MGSLSKYTTLWMAMEDGEDTWVIPVKVARSLEARYLEPASDYYSTFREARGAAVQHLDNIRLRYVNAAMKVRALRRNECVDHARQMGTYKD